MTTLSYILLLAPIVEHFQIACILLSLVAAGLGIGYIVYMCGGLTYDAPKNTSKKWPVICFTATVILALMAAIMPDRR